MTLKAQQWTFQVKLGVLGVISGQNAWLRPQHSWEESAPWQPARRLRRGHGVAGCRAGVGVSVFSSSAFRKTAALIPLFGVFSICSSWTKWPLWCSLFSPGTSSAPLQITPTCSFLRKTMTWKWNLCKHLPPPLPCPVA